MSNAALDASTRRPYKPIAADVGDTTFGSEDNENQPLVTSTDIDNEENENDERSSSSFSTAQVPGHDHDGITDHDDGASIDPRLRNYPIPLVAQTVSLANDPSEPVLTFRFLVLSTVWVVIGDAVSTVYFFKPYSSQLSSYMVQLLSWGMGDAMARWLPRGRVITVPTLISCGTRRKPSFTFSLNPGPWNAKEHALVVVAYWGSCRTAFGLGPLSALELYYGRRLPAVYGLLFLLTSQMVGYGFAGLYRDVLVRPPKLYFPGVLPNVALFNALHRRGRSTSSSTNRAPPLKFFAWVATLTFCWQWLPGVIFPMLSSLPILCYLAGSVSNTVWNRIGYILGSGRTGFGLLCLTLDWNYASFFNPLYTPLWANISQIAGAVVMCWLLYPILYFSQNITPTAGSGESEQQLPPMSSGIFDKQGRVYDIHRVMGADGVTFNQTAMEGYSDPRWATSYLMYFFWGFASTTGVLVYAVLWYGGDGYRAVVGGFRKRRRGGYGGEKDENDTNNDPYIDLMRHSEVVPHWWYLALLAGCLCLSVFCLYGADIGLRPWWGLFAMCLVSAVFIFPAGILFGLANMQVDMGFLSELLAGNIFHRDPAALLVSMTYGRTVLEQSLNLLSDYKFGFYMKIPEKAMFWAQLYGTLLGPFVNYGVMRLIIGHVGTAALTGESVSPGNNTTPLSSPSPSSSSWDALRTKNYYSISVLWGVLGPQAILDQHSWIYWSLLVGPGLVVLAYAVHRMRPDWKIETRCNPVVIMYGAALFPVFETTNLLTSALVAVFFMGYVARYHPRWFGRYGYLLGVGLDCGAQLAQTVSVSVLDIMLGGVRFPEWWGNHPTQPDRCFPPS